MEKNEVIQLQLDAGDGLLKNISEFVEEHRNGNLECVFLAYRRKNGSTRTYFIDRDNPHMFMLLERLKHDLLSLHTHDAMYAEYELDEEE